MKRRNFLAVFLVFTMFMALISPCAMAEAVTFTALEGTDNNKNQGPGFLIDGQKTPYTKWCVHMENDGSYAIIQASEEIIVTGYIFTTGNDNESWNGRNPKTWTLYGCNNYNGEGRYSDKWQEIHTVTNDTIMQNKNFEPYTFTFENTKNYQYYKLDVSEIHGSKWNILQLSEMEFIYTIAECRHEWIESTTDATCTEPAYKIERCNLCNEEQKSEISPALGHDLDSNGNCTLCGESSAAETDSKYFEDLQTAIDSASENSTVTMLKNIDIGSTLSISKNVKLDLNGFTLKMTGSGSVINISNDRTFELQDSSTDKTGVITGGNADNGGGIFVSSGTFNMTGGTVSGCTATKNGGGIFVSNGTFAMCGGSINGNKAPNGSGGAISVENSKINTSGGEMNNNSAINGGAIHLKGSTNGEIRNIKADNNTATGGTNCMGGAIFTETSGIFKILDVELSNNKAIKGGGIYIKIAKDNIYTNMYNLNIHGNYASTNGGGIFLDGNYKSNPSNSIYDSKICDNESGNNGGGIFATSDAILNLYGGTISGNTCVASGGGIRVAQSTCFIVTNYKNPLYITGNKAADGGGVSTAADMFNMVGKCEIEGNTATSRGGGVYIDRGYKSLIFNQTTVTKNTAPQGGGIYLNKDDTGYELEISGGTTIIGNTSSVNGSASNLYLNNGRMFQFRKGMTGTEKVGVSVSEIPTFSEPVDIEYVFDEQYHDKAGDRSNHIIPDNDNHKVIYKNNKHWLIPKSPLTLTADKISLSKLDEPAVLYAASYNGDRLLDIRTIPLENIEKTEFYFSEIGLNTTNATKTAAFLWDSNAEPLCESAYVSQ